MALDSGLCRNDERLGAIHRVPNDLALLLA
jgi:hypothetical protein